MGASIREALEIEYEQTAIAFLYMAKGADQLRIGLPVVFNHDPIKLFTPAIIKKEIYSCDILQ